MLKTRMGVVVQLGLPAVPDFIFCLFFAVDLAAMKGFISVSHRLIAFRGAVIVANAGCICAAIRGDIKLAIAAEILRVAGPKISVRVIAIGAWRKLCDPEQVFEPWKNRHRQCSKK